MRHKKQQPAPGSIDAIVAEMTAMDMQYGKYMQYLYAQQCRTEREIERMGKYEEDD